jgi:hypothetical protein
MRVVNMCHFYHAWEYHERKYATKGDERKQNESWLIKVCQNHENYEISVVGIIQNVTETFDWYMFCPDLCF